MEYPQVGKADADFSHSGANGVEKEVHEGELYVHLSCIKRGF